MQPAMSPRPRAYSYLRFSTPEQSKGDSHRRQIALAADYAARHGLELDRELTFEDLGVSAFTGSNAEAGRLADFRTAVATGRVQAGSFLLVEGLDRLSRLAPRKALRVLEDIVELGITVVTLTDGKAYTAESLDADPISLLVAIVTFMRANEESATKAKRVAAAWENKRRRLAEGANETYTSILPFWLQTRSSPKPDKVEIVRRIYETYRSGTGAATIARKLNLDGVTAPKGGRWNESTIKKILDHESVTGALNSKYGPIPDVFPRILDEVLVQAVRQMRASTVKGRKSAAAVHPFAGLLKCADCGASVIRVNKTGRKGSWVYLVCANAKVGHNCSYVGWPYHDAMELLAWNLDEIASSADTTENVLDVFNARAELDELAESAADAFELFKTNQKSAIARMNWNKSEQALTEARSRLRDLQRAHSHPGRKATEEALQRLGTEPTNAVMRTLFSGGTANLRTRTATLTFHGGLQVQLKRAPSEWASVL